MTRVGSGPHALVVRDADRLISELGECCRFPSVSATNDPSRHDLAQWLAHRLDRLADTVETFEPAGCAPIVLAELGAEANRGRLLVYSHYDVQPPDPVGEWQSDPFEPEVRDGALYARGVCDDKADVMARLHALEAWQATRGPLPFSIAWVCEGDEEIGSPGMRELIARRGDWMKADGCLWESYLRRGDGEPEIGFGCRGLLHVELSVQTLANDQHSAFAAILRSAAWELLGALGALVDSTGVVRVAGFRDAIASPEPEALAAVAKLPDLDASAAQLPGRSPFVTDDQDELRRRLVYEPTANITSIAAGGDAVKTIVPARARARVDFRLVPDQDPHQVAELVRAHLDSHGYEHVDCTVLTAIPPARSPLTSPLGEAVTAAAAATMGTPHRYPIIPGSGPMHLIAGGLGVPTITPPGSTRLDSGMHAPNEHARISDYLDHVHFTLRTFELLAEAAA